MARWHKSVNATIVGSIEETKYLYFHFFALVSRQNAALSFAIQRAITKKSAESEDWKCFNGNEVSQHRSNIRFPTPTVVCVAYSVNFSNITHLLINLL